MPSLESRMIVWSLKKDDANKTYNRGIDPVGNNIHSDSDKCYNNDDVVKTAYVIRPYF